MTKRKCCKCWKHQNMIIPLEGHLCPYRGCTCNGCHYRKKDVSGGIAKRGRPRTVPRQISNAMSMKFQQQMQELEKRVARLCQPAPMENFTLKSSMSLAENILSTAENRFKISQAFSETQKRMFVADLENQKRMFVDLENQKQRRGSKLPTLFPHETSSTRTRLIPPLPYTSSTPSLLISSMSSPFTSSAMSPVTSSATFPVTSSATSSFASGASSSFTLSAMSPLTLSMSSSVLLAASSSLTLSRPQGIVSTIPKELQSNSSTQENVKISEQEQSVSSPAFGLSTGASYHDYHARSKTVHPSSRFFKINSQGRTFYVQRSARSLKPVGSSMNVPFIYPSAVKNSLQPPSQDLSKPLHFAPHSFSQQKDQTIGNPLILQQQSSTLHTAAIAKQPYIKLSSSIPCLAPATADPSSPNMGKLYSLHQHSAALPVSPGNLPQQPVHKNSEQSLTESASLPELKALLTECLGDVENDADETSEQSLDFLRIRSQSIDLHQEKAFEKFEQMKMDIYHLRLIFPDLPQAFIFLTTIVNNNFFHTIGDLFAIRKTKRVPERLMKNIRSYCKAYIAKHSQYCC